MSERGSVTSARQWAGIPVCVITMLLSVMLGAAATVWGILPYDRAWIWIGASWLLTGLAGGRFAAQSGDRTLLRAVLCVLTVIVMMFLLGLTAENMTLTSHWLWYICAGLLGSILGATLPARKKKHRRKGKGTRSSHWR